MSGSSTIPQPNADDDVDIDDPVMNIDSIEVHNYISSVKVSGTGADGIPNKLYKCAAHILADPICNIANTSLLTGQVPTLFKHATISLILKKNNSAINDLRPISLLSVPSKCLEFCVLSFLRPLTSHALHSLQFAYQKGKSTCTALVSLLDQVTQILDSGDFVLLQTFDLSKAFDTVPHQILLQKLRRVLPSTLMKWVSDYLTDRSFSVKYMGEISKSFTILPGFSQGSLIGPLLFVFYMADLQHVAGYLSKYTDDLVSIIRIPKNAHDAFSLRTDAIRKKDYCHVNGLTLNHSEMPPNDHFSYRTLICRWSLRQFPYCRLD